MPRLFFYLGLNLNKAEELLQGMELQQKEEKYKKHTGRLIRKSPKIKGAY